MYYDEQSSPTGFLSGVLVGALLGATVALMLAPDSGKITRARLIPRQFDGADGDEPEETELDRESVMAVLRHRRRR